MNTGLYCKMQQDAKEVLTNFEFAGFCFACAALSPAALLAPFYIKTGTLERGKRQKQCQVYYN